MRGGATVTRYRTKGLDRFDLDQARPLGNWRASAFNWLDLAARDRRAARIAGRSADLDCRRLRRSAIERARACLANARERQGWALAAGCRLPV